MKVSVITPTYNRAPTLSETIESVLSQDYKDFEYIIVDDASTDNTESIISDYDDDRLVYIRLPENKGANVARNIGIKKSDGEVILFLDSDDIFTQDKLQKVVDEMEALPENCGGIFHSFDHIDLSGNITQTSLANDGYVDQHDLKSGNLIGGFSNIAVRSNVFDDVGYLDEEMPSYQDYEFFLRMLEKYELKGVSKILTRKLNTTPEESERRISDNLSRKIDGQKKLLSKHHSKLSNKVKSEFYYTRGFLYMDNGEIKKSREAFRKAIQTYPCNILYYYHYISTLGGKKSFDIFLRLKDSCKVLIYR